MLDVGHTYVLGVTSAEVKPTSQPDRVKYVVKHLNTNIGQIHSNIMSRVVIFPIISFDAHIL